MKRVGAEKTGLLPSKESEFTNTDTGAAMVTISLDNTKYCGSFSN